MDDAGQDPGDTHLPGERTAHLVRHLARTYQRALETRLRAEEIDFGFWVYLRILWEEEGLSLRALARRAGLTEPTTHAILGRMAARGLIERVPVAKGRRRTVVRLTPHGRALRDGLVPMALEVNATAEAGLSADDLARFRATLLKMLSNLGA